MDLSTQCSPQHISLYIHFPWCLHKCPYCDFNSHATELDSFPEQQYIDALLRDLRISCESLSHRVVKSIFIGGGTPSLLSPSSVNKILTACKQVMRLTSDCEITLETNPGTFEHQKFAEFRACGINRLSIGVQSFEDNLLRKLERIHTAKEAIEAIETAHRIGFTNINIDLMFGLPGQTSVSADHDIELACKQPVSHISYYQLTLEPNTRYHRYPPQQLPDEDESWAMQIRGIQQLDRAGYQRYEVSAYAQENSRCEHNLNYWRFGDYLGIGAGAHSKITTSATVVRNQRTRQPVSYIQAVAKGEHILHQRELTEDELIFEFLLNNLRLVEGFSINSFTALTGLNYQRLEGTVNQAITEKLLIKQQHSLRASETGYRFLDELLQRYLPGAM